MRRIGKILTFWLLIGGPLLNAGDESAGIKLPAMFEFGASKCNACKKMLPVIENLKKEYAGIMEVVFVDVWLEENLPKAVAHKIERIPTQIFFDAKGRELWRHTGYISEKDILAEWKTLGYDFAALKEARAAKPEK